MMALGYSWLSTPITIAPIPRFRGNLTCTLDYIPRHVQFMGQELPMGRAVSHHRGDQDTDGSAGFHGRMD